MVLITKIGAPEEIRTPDPQIRSLEQQIDSAQLLYKPGLNRPLEDQWVSPRAANQIDRAARATEDEVRKRARTPARRLGSARNAPHPAHPSNRLIAQLNATWRVVDHPLQWRLQRKKGNPRTKNFGWRDRSFCTTLEALLRCVREYSGNVEPAALAKLTALPQYHALQNLDVRGTDQARADVPSKTLVPKALEDSETGEQPPRIIEPALSLFVSQGD